MTQNSGILVCFNNIVHYNTVHISFLDSLDMVEKGVSRPLDPSLITQCNNQVCEKGSYTHIQFSNFDGHNCVCCYYINIFTRISSMIGKSSQKILNCTSTTS